jgi:hypothetical protein
MEQKEIKIKPNNSLISKRIYSNFVKVTKSPLDLSIQFCDVSQPSDADTLKKNDFIYDVPVVAEIVIPLKLTQGLIDAKYTSIE